MRRPLVILLLSLSLSSCGAGWHRVDPDPATPIPPRKQVLVYHGGSVERWHAVSVTRDSVGGIHWLRPIDCDSCRVALPRTQVDSLVVGDPPAGFRKSAGLGYVMILAFLFITCTQTTICTST